MNTERKFENLIILILHLVKYTEYNNVIIFILNILKIN